MQSVEILKIMPTSLVTADDLQKIIIKYKYSEPIDLFMTVYRGKKAVVEKIPVAFDDDSGTASVLLPVQKDEFNALWEFTDKNSNVVASFSALWKKAREWKLYTMISSHTDIGLHNSQYIQRLNSSKFIDDAIKLCDETDNREENDKYRYTMEGTWFWNNYGMDRGEDAAKEVVLNYIKTGKIGTCCGVAGNHIQTYGLEEMCRSTYERKRLSEDWNIKGETLSMIDNNGLSMSLIQPYVDAGYKNIIFALNQWNPLKSTLREMDQSKDDYEHNPAADGGGSRIDIRYDSELPMVFNWAEPSGKYLTVWCGTHYTWDGADFGLYDYGKQSDAVKASPKDALKFVEERMTRQLELLEERYPYNIWLIVCYEDDQKPDIELTNLIREWNSKWKFPKIRTLGNPDEPFNILRERFGKSIPVLKGDITGGWYQHPLTVPELMSKKFEADRTLPVAEKWSTVAGMVDENYEYPETDFRRAWDWLLYNDEHSYGTSEYKGRSVYETWLQHRDWIDKAFNAAKNEMNDALSAIASNIKADDDSVVVFNPTAQERVEYVELGDGESCSAVKVPSFGYNSIRASEFSPVKKIKEKSELPPVIENQYYKIKFSDNGSLCSVFDKELKKELLDTDNEYCANELVYTKDNHKSFTTPQKAKFEIISCADGISVIVKTKEENLKAEIEQKVTLLNYEKRIDIDNTLYHVKDMINNNRYYRYIYYAFPFAVDNCRRYCHLNGAVAEYAKDITGHGTDVYMAVNEWCCSENDDFGVALFMKDSHITEFDHIHSDKTDFANAGEGSQMFSYVANDWLQKHTPGGSHIDYRLKYSITSYQGGYKAAKIPQMAERYTNPVTTVRISAQDGSLPQGKHSFLKLDNDLRFVCLKRADDGKGIIARFYGDASNVCFDAETEAERSTVDERKQLEKVNNGFITYRLWKNKIRLKTRQPQQCIAKDGVPAPIGSVYTGLITKPCAAAGENSGQLYLLWGANREEDFSHYKLYRSEVSGFVPSEENFVADIFPEEYVVGRFEDTGLKIHTCYYYRVCAVNKDGAFGEMSDEFCGITREEIAE